MAHIRASTALESLHVSKGSPFVVYLPEAIYLFIVHPLPSSFLSHGGWRLSEILNVLFALNTQRSEQWASNRYELDSNVMRQSDTWKVSS